MVKENKSEIRVVSVEVVRPLRHDILRTGKPFSTTLFDRDEESKTVHFALYRDKEVLSVATIFPASFSQKPQEKAYQLRGMATKQKEQGKGFGRQILEAVIDYLREQTDAKLLWCNARRPAVDFYQKFGFEFVGEEFEVEGIGPHRVGYFILDSDRGDTINE